MLCAAVHQVANGTKRTYRGKRSLVRFRSEADIDDRLASISSVADDPKRTSASALYMSAPDPIVALLRDFGAVRQMPELVKRARCPTVGLPARLAQGKAATTITSTSIPGRQKSVVRQARTGGFARSTHSFQTEL